MKKITAIALLVISLQAFGSKTADVHPVVNSSFSRDFRYAKDVQWEDGGNYIKVSFVLDQLYLAAFYNNDGELIGTARNLASDQLPLKLFLELKKNYSDRWVTELIEFSTDKEQTYYICLENAEEQLILKSNGSKGWSFHKKLAKS